MEEGGPWCNEHPKKAGVGGERIYRAHSDRLGRTQLGCAPKESNKGQPLSRMSQVRGTS
jgi:hypothetical protein